MQGFALNENGDIILQNRDKNTVFPNGWRIQLIEGDNLIAQKISIVLGINKGEWFWNSDLGIDFDYLIGKGITDDMIRSQIELGIHQVDEGMYITEFNVDVDKSTRIASVTFTAKSDGGTIVKGSKAYGVENAGDLQDKLTVANNTIRAYNNAVSRLANRLENSN